jgi:hypothetical protein
MPRNKKTEPDHSEVTASDAIKSKKAVAQELPNENITLGDNDSMGTSVSVASEFAMEAAKQKKGSKAKTAAFETVDEPEPQLDTVRKYTAKGVLLSLEVPEAYEPVKITYNGLLARNGATELYARAGIGPQWDNVQEVAMTKTANGFEGIALAVASSTLNVCFHDAAYNWDNNSNENYVFSVTG